MKVKYATPRVSHIRGPLICVLGGGRSVKIKFGETVEVDDNIGYKLLAKYGDILEQLGNAPKVKTKKQTAQVKVSDDKQVKGYQDTADLAGI